MRNTIVDTLTEYAKKDDRIFLITADLGFGVLDEYIDLHPDKFLNVGVSEQNMIGVATGLALEGRNVFVYSIGNFSTLRCLEQIRNDICYHDANVTVISIGAGFSYGQLGMTHHATEDVSIMRSMPMNIGSPSDIWEAGELTKYFIANKGPHYLRVDKSETGINRRADEIFEFGKARLIREGKDITFISTASILNEAMKAAEELENRFKLSSRVLHYHTLKPFDSASLLDAIDNTSAIVTLEEHNIQGGLGSIVAEVCADNLTMPNFFKRLGLRDGFTSIVGSQSYLRDRYSLSARKIVDEVSAMFLLETV